MHDRDTGCGKSRLFKILPQWLATHVEKHLTALCIHLLNALATRYHLKYDRKGNGPVKDVSSFSFPRGNFCRVGSENRDNTESLQNLDCFYKTNRWITGNCTTAVFSPPASLTLPLWKCKNTLAPLWTDAGNTEDFRRGLLGGSVG